MATKIDLELTSRRDDGTWTWRAAGARQPKGEVDAGLLPDGASVGDVLKAEIDKAIDGITVVSVHAPKSKKSSADERLELLGSGRSEQLVTTQLAPKGRGRGDRRRRLVAAQRLAVAGHARNPGFLPAVARTNKDAAPAVDILVGRIARRRKLRRPADLRQALRHDGKGDGDRKRQTGHSPQQIHTRQPPLLYRKQWQRIVGR